MKPIGPNFLNELAAAGLSHLSLTYTERGDIFFGPGVSTNDKLAVQIVLDAHDYRTVPPLPVPHSVSIYQGREAMRSWVYAGSLEEPETLVTLYDATLALMNDPSTPAYYKVAWEEMTSFEFDSPLLIAIADVLGLTLTDREQLFRHAGTFRI